MNTPTPSITVNVDLTNPGQFFACCGLLELADRLWPGAEGWFDEEEQLCIAVDPDAEASSTDLITSLIDCSIVNTMTKVQLHRLKELKAKKKNLGSQEATEKKSLEKRWREEAIILPAPFSLRIDWFLDKYADGSRFKTWAGQQSVIDIARAMKASMESDEWRCLESDQWLSRPAENGGVPFNFDSNLGPQSSSIDVGYSLDALRIPALTRPLIELGAFIGLQRFRPTQIGKENLYRYRAWRLPLGVELAAVAASTDLLLSESSAYDFRLLYRTKYLKSFLPATPVGVTP